MTIHARSSSTMPLLLGAADKETAALPTTGIFRILVCRITHSLGNTLLLTPLIRELQATYPGAEIDIVTRAEVADLIFGAFASVRNIYRLPAHAFRHPLQFLAVLRRLRVTRYDLVIDPCPRSRTGRWLTLFAKGRFKLGFTGSNKRGKFTHGVPVPLSPRHTAQRPVYLLRSALQRSPSSDYPLLKLDLSLDEREQGRSILARLLAGNPGKKGVIGVFANATGPKLLPEDWWHAFMDSFAHQHLDYAIVEIVPMFGRALLGTRYPAYYSSDIRRLSSVLSCLSLFVSADCGVLHLACASGAPVAGIFSVTDPEEWGPYGPHDCVLTAQGQSPQQVAQQIRVPSSADVMACA
jgi:heptosyltransferase-3